MGELDFADGFDISGPLLWGLVPAQLGSIAAGVTLGYVALRSPLPLVARTAIGVLLAGCAVGISIVRVDGRTLLAWVGSAARFWGRRRARLILIEGRDGETVSSGGPVAKDPRSRTGSLVALCHAERDHASERGSRPERLVFFSLAGGSGRTTLAVEVAALLASAGGATLVDMDLLSPRASLRLGIPLRTLRHDLLDACPAEALIAVHPTGLRVVPGHSGTGDVLFAEDSRLVDVLEAVLRKLEPERGTVLLDIAPGLAPVARWALDTADVIAVVLTPTAGGLQDAYRSTEVLRRLGHARKLRYVVNRGTDASLFEEAMADLGGTVVGYVPEDPELTRAEAEHRLISAGVGPTARSLRLLAARLVAPVQPEAAPALRVAPLLGAPPRRERAG